VILIEQNKCPICKTASENNENPLNKTHFIDCKRCGHYYITTEALNDNILDLDLTAKLSYWIRNNENKKITITNSIIGNIKEISLPNLKEQINNLILFLGKKSRPGDNYDSQVNSLISIVGCFDSVGLLYVVDYLRDNNYVKIENIGSPEPLRERDINILSFLLTFKGWDKYDEIKSSSDIGKISFMAIKYGNVSLEKVYEENIKDAVKQTGFEIQLLRDVLRAGSIDDQLRVQIRGAKFLLVDLTDDNNGAYWEAGFAEGLNKPVIYLCEKDKFDKFKTHFDTNHLTTVLWKSETIQEDMENLKGIIRNTFPLEAILED